MIKKTSNLNPTKLKLGGNAYNVPFLHMLLLESVKYTFFSFLKKEGIIKDGIDIFCDAGMPRLIKKFTINKKSKKSSIHLTLSQLT